MKGIISNTSSGKKTYKRGGNQNESKSKTSSATTAVATTTKMSIQRNNPTECINAKDHPFLG
jgi:hypothetical protein